MAVFVAGVAEPLDGLVFKQRSLISEAAEFQLVGPDVLGKVPGGKARRTRLEHQHFHSVFSQLLGNPASAGSRADHEGVVNLAVVRGHHAARRGERKAIG